MELSAQDGSNPVAGWCSQQTTRLAASRHSSANSSGATNASESSVNPALDARSATVNFPDPLPSPEVPTVFTVESKSQSSTESNTA
ncbi:hypothetical protein T265_02468 [Opisthorchis viverrini]|uniref:Uncharacterized protein n=1 Tax=Opisthorchis viverrini TaxID=6198 RepID=A0A075A6L6_OPIVI|nr:hypothetical protein T265_02468 [Opisthorchis viverrini]KER31285.1 hypothetical protein T265_02468 [Opisthorchis viverrini]